VRPQVWCNYPLFKLRQSRKRKHPSKRLPIGSCYQLIGLKYKKLTIIPQTSLTAERHDCSRTALLPRRRYGFCCRHQLQEAIEGRHIPITKSLTFNVFSLIWSKYTGMTVLDLITHQKRLAAWLVAFYNDFELNRQTVCVNCVHFEVCQLQEMVVATFSALQSRTVSRMWYISIGVFEVDHCRIFLRVHLLRQRPIVGPIGRIYDLRNCAWNGQ